MEVITDPLRWRERRFSDDPGRCRAVGRRGRWSLLCVLDSGHRGPHQDFWRVYRGVTLWSWK